MLRDFQLLHSVGTLAGLTDGALMESVRSGSREGDLPRAEAALGALVERHAAMVWSVCRAVAGGVQDAEDAFQATFLILVRKAGSIRVEETLGPWLHVVAYRTALAMRTSTARRRQAEDRAAALRGEAAVADDSALNLDQPEIPHAAIHAEIVRLPERFRSVVVLCDLEGLSYLEAARRLDVPLGTVQSRLARARARLRRALDPQGIRANDSAFGLVLTASLPASLARRTSRLGALISADTASIPAELTAPIRDGIRSCSGIGWRRALAAPLGGAAIVGGCFLYAGSVPQEPAPPSVQQPPARPAKVEKPALIIPAPQKLKIASGKGKTVLYTLDAEGKRIRERADQPKGPFRTIEHEMHWAVITGILDHDGLKKMLREADLQPSRFAYELYARIELERQTRDEDGAWSGWEEVDKMPTLDILDRLPYAAEERVAARYRVENVVDPLPWLTSGRWEGVDVDESLLLQTKPEPKSTPTTTNPTQIPGSRTGAAPGDWVSSLMFRSFDFTAAPGQTYRYRARAVLFNPAFPRTKRGSKFVFSPWSEPTAAVTIP